MGSDVLLAPVADRVEIGRGLTRAAIDLDGGRLASFRAGGTELLVTEGAKPSRWGSFPMVPWCGRLADGVLDFDGARHRFPLTSPPHANHGVGHLQRWAVVAGGVGLGDEPADDVVLATDLEQPWPFGGRVEQRFTVDELGLTVTMTVEATDQAMPAMVGWHPWFRRRLDTGGPADVIVRPAVAHEVDERMIPTGRMAQVPARPWNECFGGMAKPPRIRWDGVLDLEIDSDLDHWVVFTEPDDAVCVEPQSGPPNQLNSGPVRLEPGQRLSGTMSLRWRPVSSTGSSY